MKNFIVRLSNRHVFLCKEVSERAAIKRIEKMFGRHKWVKEEDLEGKGLLLEMKTLNDAALGLTKLEEV
jgi:hypothetical protein